MVESEPLERLTEFSASMQRIRQILPILLTLSLLCLAIGAIVHELRAYSLQTVLQSLENISKTRKLTALLLTGVGYSIITGYDLLAFRYIRHSLAWGKIMFTSFLSYAIGNTVGLTLFSGTAIRYRFYRPWGVSSVNIAKIIAFTHLSFWLGMFTVGGVVFLIDPLTLPDILHLPFDSVHPLGVMFLAFAVAYLIISISYKKPLKLGSESIVLPSIPLSLGVMVVSLLDWGVAAGVLYLLLPAHLSLSYWGFFGIFVVAFTAGIISNVPGGLGVFETVIIWLRPPSVSTPEVVGALLAYRGIYFFVPLLVALGLWLIHEIQQHRHRQG